MNDELVHGWPLCTCDCGCEAMLTSDEEGEDMICQDCAEGEHEPEWPLDEL